MDPSNPRMSPEPAERLAREQLREDDASGWAGFVVEAPVSTKVFDAFDVQTAGRSRTRRLRVPSARAQRLNDMLAGRLQVRSAWFGARYTGPVATREPLRNLSATSQVVELHRRMPLADCVLEEMILYHMPVFLLNFGWWAQTDLSGIGFSSQRTRELLDQITRLWVYHYPELQLPHSAGLPEGTGGVTRASRSCSS